MTTFQEMQLPESLKHSLQLMQFDTPTPIQSQAIPPALEGKDLLGSAQTGTGKTGAFGIPLVANLLSNPIGSAMVMTPTRELASQVMEQLKHMLGKKSKIASALLIGGDPMPKQLLQLRKKPRVIVGTPGRINDHLRRGTLKLKDTGFLVLDETDRMLDMGFSIQIESILEYMNEKRQTLLFSATLPSNIVSIAKKYLHNPVRISLQHTSKPASKIQQEITRTTESEKFTDLLTELDEREGSIILFVKTKFSTEKIAKRLMKEGHSACAIHGDLRQNKRTRVLAAFRKQKYRILVATDVASRGLDIPHIEHVINYDLPQCAEDYIHRIGRTARAGAQGSALTLLTPADKGKWKAIDRLLNPDQAQKGSRSSRNKRGNSRRNAPFSRAREDKKSFGRGGRSERSSRGSEKPFGRSEKSFRGAEKPFGRGEKSFKGSEKAFGRGDKSFKGGNKPFGRGEKSFKGGEKAFGRGEKSFKGGEKSFKGGEKAFGRGEKSFKGGDKPFGRGEKSFKGGDKPFGRGEKSFKGGDKPFGRGEKPSRGGEKAFGRSEKSSRGGEKAFGRGKKAFKGGERRNFSGKGTHSDIASKASNSKGKKRIKGTLNCSNVSRKVKQKEPSTAELAEDLA